MTTSSLLPAVVHETYLQAINQIVSGAKKLKTVMGNGDDDDKPSSWLASEEEGLYGRIPPSAYCLRLAYSIWQDTAQLYERNTRWFDADDDEPPYDRETFLKAVVETTKDMGTEVRDELIRRLKQQSA